MKTSFLISLLISILFAFTACTSIPETDENDNSKDEEILSSDNQYSEELSQMESEDTASSEGEEPAEESNDTAAATDDEPEEEEAEPMATAEEPEPEPAPTPAPTPSPKKSTKKDKSAMRTLSQDCNMRSEPSSKGKKIKTIKGGKKLWTEDAGPKYFKVYRKNGAAYISKSCF